MVVDILGILLERRGSLMLNDTYVIAEHLLEGSDDEDSDEDDEAPGAVPIPLKNLPSPDSNDEFDNDDIDDDELDVDEDDEDDEDEEDEDDEDEEEEDEDEDDEDEEDEDEDDDEDDEQAFVEPEIMGSSDEDNDGDDGEDSDEEEEDEEEEDLMHALARKRAKIMSTPQPQKKSRKEEAPATAPSKVNTAKVPSNEKEYEQQLKLYLKEHGPSKLSNLGTAVKKPSSVPKLKRFLSTHAKTFSYNQSTDTVSLN